MRPPPCHSGSLHLITLHLLSTLEISLDRSSFPRSIYFLQSLYAFTFLPITSARASSDSSTTSPPFVFSLATPDRLSSASTSLSPPVSLLYPSLHSEFLLANCSGVEAHRSSPLMLTLLHDSCWRNPTGTRRTGGARGGERLRQRDGRRGQGKTKEGRERERWLQSLFMQ